jgi:S1-C subfamily serine protease
VWLRVLSGEDAGRVVEVTEPLTLGRVRGAGLVIRDARAARRHAELAPAEGGLVLRDLGSANGTLVDGAPVSGDVRLAGGEEIVIGDVRIAVLAEEPAVTGTPAGPRVVVETEGPSWSLVGRLLEARTRRVRRAMLGALGVAAAALVAIAVVALTGRSEDEKVADAVRAATPATVRIEARRSGVRSGLGSGWVLDAGEGLVVTAAHVVNGGRLFFADDELAEVVGVAPCDDLALLRVPGGLGDASLELGGARRGDTVLALGFPETAETGDRASPARGTVADDDAALRDPAPDVPPYTGVLRTDAVLDRGFSGGPLVDLDGRVAGVGVAARTADGGPLAREGYAVPAERVRAVLETLRGGRSIGWMGANLSFPAAANVAALRMPPGLWVQGVVPGTGADRAGLRDGDYVVSVDGRPLGTTLASWCAAAGGMPSGRTADLELVARDGRRRTVAVRFD